VGSCRVTSVGARNVSVPRGLHTSVYKVARALCSMYTKALVCYFHVSPLAGNTSGSTSPRPGHKGVLHIQ
jgi:hypothetical protein